MAIAFELISEDYYEADGTHLVSEEDDDAEKSDWESKAAWNNYHRCWIGKSQTSSAAGIPVSDGTRAFAFDQEEYHFSADPLPVDWDDFFDQQAFGIYLLGHDAVADHKIHLHSRRSDGSYTLDWTGKIARTYMGETEFTHDFIARVDGVKFDAISLWYFDPAIAKEQLGIEMDPNMTPRDYIAPFVADPDQFRFEKRNGVLHAVYMG
jgi:hypothetical protein